MGQLVGKGRPNRLRLWPALISSLCVVTLNCAVLTAGERVKEAEPFRLLLPGEETSDAHSSMLPVTVELAASASRLTRPTTPQGENTVNLPVIDGRDIAVCSVQNWTPAHVLRARGRTIERAYREQDECSQQAAQALVTFLNMQANHQEDIGAATALRAYYTRIAIGEHLNLSAESLRLVESERAKQQAALKSGLPIETDLSDFQRRRITIEDRRLQLLSQERQLRKLLAQLAGIDYSLDSVRQEALDVVVNSLDCEHLQTIALHSRHDIRAWAHLAGETDETSVPVFARMLPTAVGGFGLPIPASSGLKDLLFPADHACVSASMKQELCLTVEAHRRWISQAVNEKCAQVELAYQRLDLARQTVVSWENRIGQLEQLADLGKAAPQSLALARVGRLEARSEEINRRLDARTAEVDLSEATGGLSCRCRKGLPWLLTGHE